jgi:hypothetical protein
MVLCESLLVYVIHYQNLCKLIQIFLVNYNQLEWYPTASFFPMHGLATIIVGVAGLAGYALDVAQITEIVVSASALVAGILSTVGSLKRKGAIDPTLVMRLPRGRDVRLPVLPHRENRTGTGRDPGPFGF